MHLPLLGQNPLFEASLSMGAKLLMLKMPLFVRGFCYSVGMEKILSDTENVHIVDSLGQPVGELWQRLQGQYLAEAGTFNVASPLSSTPLPVYGWLAEHREELDWDGVNFLLMDEQVEGAEPPFRYIDMKDPASYERFAHAHLLDALQRDIPVLKPDLDNLETFKPQIHLLVLAVGVRGNYANVMPETPLNTSWHVTELIDEFRQVHTQRGAYAGATFRTHGMSLGPQQVLAAEHVVVIASGTAKRELVRQLFSYDDFDLCYFNRDYFVS